MIGIGVSLIPLILLLGSFRSDQPTSPKVDAKFLPDLAGNVEPLSPSSPVILRVNIHGIIGMEGGVLADDLDLILTESRRGQFANDRVKGVLLHINTPGGTSTASNAMYQYLEEYKKQYNVPIFAYVEGLCASGGMYLGCAADKILSSDMSVIGSVGVVAGPFFNAYTLMEKIGLEAKTLTEGKDKDSLNMFRPWKSDEGASIQEILSAQYERFVDLVAQSRPRIDKEALVQTYGAQLFDAAKAQELGYIDDGNSSYKKTLQELLVAANIEEGTEYQVVEMSPKNSWFEDLFSGKSYAWHQILSSLFWGRGEHLCLFLSDVSHHS